MARSPTLTRVPLLAIEKKAWHSMEQRLLAMKAEDIKVAFDLFGQGTNKRSTVPVERLSADVAVVTLAGVVSRDGPDWIDMLFGMDGFSTKDLEKVAGELKADPSLSTVILNWHSPGGTVEGTASAADAIMELRKSGKRVISYAPDLMCSAAYWIGSQADEIYIGTGAEIGSIGCFQVVPDYSKAYEAEGVKINLVKSAPGKGAGMHGTAITDDTLKEFQSSVDAIHALFVSSVSAGRGMRKRYERGNADATPVPDDGRVYLGQNAVEVGLADGIKTYGSLVAEVLSRPRPTGMSANSNPPSKGATRMKNLATMFGLPEDATESQITAAAAAKFASVDELIRGMEARAKESADKALAAFRAEQRIDTLVKTFVTKAGKITSKQSDAARKLAAADPDAFEAFMADMPVVTPTADAARIKTDGDVPTTEAAPVVLNPRNPDHREAIAERAAALQAKDPSLSWEQAVNAVVTPKESK